MPALSFVPAIRSCTVSYQDLDGITHSVDVTAETLYEAAILGMNALKVPRWHDNPNLKIQIRVRQPETAHDGVELLFIGLADAGRKVAERRH